MTFPSALMEYIPLFAALVALLVFAIVLQTLLTNVLSIPGVLEPIPISHKIAVIGLPKSGKTTLITVIFELIQKGTYIREVRLHGVKTINTVNKLISLLNSGHRVGPTTEKEIFVFRFSYQKRGLLKKLFDVEIADFPGEYSGKLLLESDLEEDNQRRTRRRGAQRKDSESGHSNDELDFALFGQEFFSWIASAREYLFLIDLSAIYSAEKVKGAIADISARIRTSWQIIEDATSERGIGGVRGREVHIVFTKVDCLFAVYRLKVNLEMMTYPDRLEKGTHETIEKIKQHISMIGSEENLSDGKRVDEELLNLIKSENDCYLVI